MTLIDRLFEFMHHQRISPYTFERECAIANGYLKKQKKGKGTMGSEIIEKINQKYPSLSLNWLITGRGKMLVDEEYQVAGSSPLNMHDKEIPYAAAEQTMVMLREKIVILENAIADKEKIIRLLEQGK